MGPRQIDFGEDLAEYESIWHARKLIYTGRFRAQDQDEVPSMQTKIGRWEGLYPRIQSAAKHIRCGFVCGYRKIAGPFRSERSAIIGAAQPRVHGPDPSEHRATKKGREQ
jgi:hypothetical protein